ncbi:YtrH family sporulation protein [Paenibacillus sp. GCM10023252]|uniref:YtrH family sporulation protein n=1 Tax=Paenibacillus sp. GCM10023252 TaxID=3252649 RepID=UPI003621DCF6
MSAELCYHIPSLDPHRLVEAKDKPDSNKRQVIGMNYFLTKAGLDFFTAFGVVLGGAMLAGIGSIFMMLPPTAMMLDTADRLKIWAIVAAIGGSIDPVRVIESNINLGHLSPAFQQICYIIIAFLGAHLATELVRLICKGAA